MSDFGVAIHLVVVTIEYHYYVIGVSLYIGLCLM